MKKIIIIVFVSLIAVWILAHTARILDTWDNSHNLFDYSKVLVPEDINNQRLMEIESNLIATLDNPLERLLITSYVATELSIEEGVITSMSNETQGIYSTYKAYIFIFIPYAEITTNNGSIVVER